jgi:signal peptidase II
VRDSLFFSLTLVVFLVILGILIRTEPRHWMVLVALTGVLAGAMGNFVDRIRYGYVIDFIDMDLGFMHWPTYNVADIGISCGVVLLMFDITFNPESPLVTEPETSEAETGEEEASPDQTDESPATS